MFCWVVVVFLGNMVCVLFFRLCVCVCVRACACMCVDVLLVFVARFVFGCVFKEHIK